MPQNQDPFRKILSRRSICLSGQCSMLASWGVFFRDTGSSVTSLSFFVSALNIARNWFTLRQMLLPFQGSIPMIIQCWFRRPCACLYFIRQTTLCQGAKSNAGYFAWCLHPWNKNAPQDAHGSMDLQNFSTKICRNVLSLKSMK